MQRLTREAHATATTDSLTAVSNSFLDFSRFILAIFERFFKFLKFLHLSGPVRTCSDLIGYVRMHSDALGSAWRFSEKFGLFSVCSMFLIGCFEVFGCVRTCSDLLGPIRIRSDAFGCIRMPSDALGRLRKIFQIICSFHVCLIILHVF